MITRLRRLVALALRRSAAFVDSPAPVLEPALTAPSETALALAAMQAKANSILLERALHDSLHRFSPRSAIASA